MAKHIENAEDSIMLGGFEKSWVMTIAQKIIKASHLVSGDMTPGSEVALRIDQTLTQDATGTMAYLEFEAMGVPRVKTELSRRLHRPQHPAVAALKTPTTTAIIQIGAPKSTACISPARATASAIRCIWSASASPARPSSVRTAIPPPAAASACWPSARAAWTWRWPWAAARTISPCPKWYKVNLTGKLQTLRHRQGRHSGGAAHPLRQGRRGRDHRMGRRGRGHPVRARSGPPSPTWGPSWALPPPSSPPTRSPRAFLEAQGREEDYVPLSSRPGRGVR